jgi:hypothetical protein
MSYDPKKVKCGLEIGYRTGVEYRHETWYCQECGEKCAEVWREAVIRQGLLPNETVGLDSGWAEVVAANAKIPLHVLRMPGPSLAEAAWDGNFDRCLELVDAGEPLDGTSSNGKHSALNGASRNGHAAIVALLLERGQPDIESRSQGQDESRGRGWSHTLRGWEMTPLQQAAFHGHAEVAKILLEYGASTTSKSGTCHYRDGDREGHGDLTAKEIAKAQSNRATELFVRRFTTVVKQIEDVEAGAEKAAAEKAAEGRRLLQAALCPAKVAKRARGIFNPFA